MHILVATSEAVPFCKTGGLADVCGSLPREIPNLGHQASLVLPAYRQVLTSQLPIEKTGIEFEIPIGRKNVTGSVLTCQLGDSGVPVYFIQQDTYFDRGELYSISGVDYPDNCARFVFFCRAIMELATQLPACPDVIHCNDWMTGLIPAYLQTEYAGRPGYEQIATILTIHNIAYQGNFWHWDMELTGIDWKHFNWQEMEFYGNLSFLKSGIAMADKINTVSPTYAEQILSPPWSCGMEDILRHRRDDLCGIINGIDVRLWNPETDIYLVTDGYANYDVESVSIGKKLNKAALQRELNLPQHDMPLIGIIGRLVDQKGFDLVTEVMKTWVRSQPVQWVILGTGEPRYHKLLAELEQLYPQNVSVRLEFSNKLAHRIEAGADLFLMPSQFEPCGLNQLYSLRYGTLPVVHATGGLADTITNTTDETLALGTANGFSFVEHSSDALATALHHAIATYANRHTWSTVQTIGMQQDWSWAHSAQKYLQLYESAIAKRKASVLA
ncbi:MAG: glycogen synthase GlgA [Pirellulales bacterium]|nr:glycogen synthase GlgA [Pirellulales bacterium]